MKGTAWILTVGNELLIGRVVNTNAAWLARKLTHLGYTVRRAVTVPDAEEDIVEAFRSALSAADVVVSTGGLGPTPDDMTNLAFCRAVNRPAVVNPEALAMVREKYAARGYPMTPEREKMAVMPPGARPLPNPVGTAPGILYEEGGRLAVLLPGVPREMEAIFEAHVEPLLKARGPPFHFAEGSLWVRGVPEADLAPIIRDVMGLDARLYVKSHPRGLEVGAPLVEVHIYAGAPTAEEAAELVRRGTERFLQLVRSKHADKAEVRVAQRGDAADVDG